MARCMCFMLVIIVCKTTVRCSIASFSENECPPHKPFWSSVGCIDECPEPYYKNNTECVTSCGDVFVDKDRKCVQACDSTDFIHETLKYVKQEFLERKCVKACPYFIFNNTCTDMCPTSSKFLLGDYLNIADLGKRLCVEQCPDTCQYKTNVTYESKTVTFCSQECPLYHENGYCVTYCSEGNVVLDRTCYAVCPKSHPVRNQWGMCTELCTPINFETGACECPQNMSYIQNKTCVAECSPNMYKTPLNNRQICVETCHDGHYSLNNTCVMTCPYGMFIASGECLHSCPVGMPYYGINYHDDGSLNTIKQNILYTCFKMCPPGMYIEKFVCTILCSNYTVDQMCQDACPDNKPLVFENVTGIDCYNNMWCTNLVHQKHCVRECPLGYFQRKDECITTCEQDEFILHATCLHECPKNLKSRKETILFNEFFRDDTNYYNRYGITSKSILANRCVDNCETNEFEFNNTCVSACPPDHQYVTDSHCGIGPCVTDLYYNKNTYLMCVNTCNNNDFIMNNNICVNMCPNTTFAWNSTCVYKCPNNANYYTNVVMNTCKYSCSIKTVDMYAICNEMCAEDMYALNNSCLYSCPWPYVSVSGSCLLACPHNLPFKNTTTLKTKEWRQNKDNTWTYQTYDNIIVECVSVCNRRGRPLDSYTLKCVEACPNSSEYVQDNVCRLKCSENMVANKEAFGMECRVSCPDGKLLYNYTCMPSCPIEASYQYEGNCVSSCPSESPFGVVDMNNRCVKGCEDRKLYYNGHCVYHSDCNDTMIEFEGQCLEQCPEGYRYSFTNDCLKDSNIIVALLMFIVTLVAVCTYTHPIIVDYGRVWWLLIRWRSSGVPDFLKILEQQEPLQFEIDDDPFLVMSHNQDINDVGPLLQLEELT